MSEVSVASQGKSKLLAYVFWFFLGVLGAHRFYWGKWKSGLALLALPLVGFGVFVLGSLGVIAGVSLDSVSGGVAGGIAAAVGLGACGVAGIWLLLDAVFILTWR